MKEVTQSNVMPAHPNQNTEFEIDDPLEGLDLLGRVEAEYEIMSNKIVPFD